MGAPWQASQEYLVQYSAAVLRTLLRAMSRPGSIELVPPPTALAAMPASDDPIGDVAQSANAAAYNQYALGALATLLDRETSFVLAASGSWMEHEVSLSRWLVRTSGARQAGPDSADFALCLDGSGAALLRELRQGTDAAPEESATAFISVSGLAAKVQSVTEGTTLKLQGPGIRETSLLTVVGLPAAGLQGILDTRQSYPLGVDVVLIDGQGHCAALPRTTRLSLLPGGTEEG